MLSYTFSITLTIFNYLSTDFIKDFIIKNIINKCLTNILPEYKYRFIYFYLTLYLLFIDIGVSILRIRILLD